MRKKIAAFWDRYGYYCLVGLCLTVVVCAAVFTRREDEARVPFTPSAVDQGERLSDVTYVDTTLPPSPAPPILPFEGAKIARGFSKAPIYFAASSCFKTHPATDFSVQEGALICAVLAGTVQKITDNTLTVAHQDFTKAMYVGIKNSPLLEGDAFKQGDALGQATAYVSGEGAGLLHIVYFASDGTPLPLFEK